MNKEFFINNRKKYLDKVDDSSLSLFFSGKAFQKSADQDFDFEVDKNFYYLAGINQANVILAIVKDNDNFRSALFIEKNDPVLVKWVGYKLEINEAKELSGIDEVYYLDNFENFVYSCFNSSRKFTGTLRSLYLNLERRNEAGYTHLALEYAEKFKKTYPEVRIRNSYLKVVELRMFKTEEELAIIKKAINTTKGGLELIMKNLKPGMYENQMEAYFNFHLQYTANSDTAFETIAASGKNATILHYVANNQKINDNELMLFDLGARDGFYVSDISRTYPTSGKFTKRQREVYEEVLNVNKLCIEFLKPGVTWVEYNKYASDLLAKACIRLGLIKEPKELIKYYYHSIGHSIGLDTHDPANGLIPISEGMILTVEPGIYIEEENIGVRIEDNILITKDGRINLSEDIIKEVDDIEKFMAAK
ncbi:MAG: aminopeptidase P family protein [Bacilli bacterium]|nr:aminopeptidase P family protein [Bacilli bacterium]